MLISPATEKWMGITNPEDEDRVRSELLEIKS